VPRISLGDVETYYELRGEGAPLLLAMGWRGNLDWWPEPLVASLARRHRVLLFDNRGAGRTGDPGGVFTMARMADDAAALLEALSIPRAHVFGVSMGGMIAQELALRHPQRVERLVLLATHCGRRAVRWTPAIARAWARWLRAPTGLDRHLLYMLFSEDIARTDPKRFAEFARVVMKHPMGRWTSFKQYLAILGHDTWGRLPRLAAPTLVLAGERDLMIAPENSRMLAARIPNARLVTFPRTGHALLREKVREIDELLADFLGADQAGAAK
jgi:3-oxoadipate enol-lactonase